MQGLFPKTHYKLLEDWENYIYLFINPGIAPTFVLYVNNSHSINVENLMTTVTVLATKNINKNKTLPFPMLIYSLSSEDILSE